MFTVFDLITAPALITTPLTFYFTFTYYRPLDDLFPDFLLYFHLLSPTWRSFGTSGREQIHVSARAPIRSNTVYIFLYRLILGDKADSDDDGVRRD